jgi:hypothetical protein
VQAMERCAPPMRRWGGLAGCAGWMRVKGVGEGVMEGLWVVEGTRNCQAGGGGREGRAAAAGGGAGSGRARRLRAARCAPRRPAVPAAAGRAARLRPQRRQGSLLAAPPLLQAAWQGGIGWRGRSGAAAARQGPLLALPPHPLKRRLATRAHAKGLEAPARRRGARCAPPGGRARMRAAGMWGGGGQTLRRPGRFSGSGTFSRPSFAHKIDACFARMLPRAHAPGRRARKRCPRLLGASAGA